MIDPRMAAMGMGPLPDVPSQEQLWANEKSKFRHWIILFGIGIFAIVCFYLASLIWGIIDGDSIKAQIQEALDKDPDGSSQTAQTIYNFNNIATPSVILVILISSLVFYGYGVYESYKAKTFIKLSPFPNIIIAIGAALAAYQVISQAWSNAQTFHNNTGIFSFISNLLLLVVWVVASRPVSIIRRQFMVSKQITDLKNSPQYKQMQEMMQNGAAAPQGMGPFGPISSPAQSQAPQNVQGQVINQTPVQQIVVSKDQQELEKLTLTDLKQVAKKLSISGAEKMSKEELIKAVIRVTEKNNE